MKRHIIQLKLDNEISRTWHQLASGVVVSMMDIPKIFAECRNAVLVAGLSVEDAVKNAIVKYEKRAGQKMICINEKELSEKLKNTPDQAFFDLILTAAAIERLNLKACNEGNVEDNAYDIYLNVLNDLMKAGQIPPVKVQHDPRGPAVKLYFPDKSYNTAGGEEEGYGILFEESDK